MKMITLAQYCLKGVGHDLSYHQALQDLQGDVFEEVITYLPKTHVVPNLSSNWQRFFSVPKRRFEMFPLRLFDYFRMYRLAHQPTVFFLETFN
ncbi:MAG: hypothetical protein KBC64_05015, partial [Simkaniaceae bacterium]|nr:hypothetical protein [Simkaniaceae bacterium]